MHPRKAIRQRVIDILTGAVPEVGTRVFRSRSYPLQRDQELPGICVFTLREPAELMTQVRTLNRMLDLAIDVYASDPETPDDELDDIAEAVEALMEADPQLNRLATNSWLAETIVGFDGQGEQANGICRLRYTVQYLT